jgi:hypothetical protein
MTSMVEPAAAPRSDVRTIVGGGVTLGIATVIGVVAFALLSRALAGGVETVVQSVLVLAGGAVFAYAPAYWVRPRGVDAIAYAALVGLLGSVVFTVADTAVLRPVHLYHWTWDAIGGGSGFWYIPVWWMGSCFLAWLGGWVYSIRAERDTSAVSAAIQTLGIGVVLLVVAVATRLAPFHAAVAALAFTVGLVLQVPLAAVLRNR